MPARTLPGLGLTAYYDLGEDGWNVTLDPDLRLLSMVAQLAVDSLAAAEPGVPTQGDSVLLTGTANVNRVAIYDDSAWVYLEPNPGWQLYDNATGQNYQWDGTSWNAEGPELPQIGSGDTGKLVTVNSAEDGFDLSSPPTALPAISGGDTLKVLRVNAGETAYELATPDDFGITHSTESSAFSVTNTQLSGTQYVTVNFGSDANITIPDGLTGTEPVTFFSIGVGIPTFVAGGAAAIRSLDSNVAFAGQYGAVTLVPRGSNTYDLFGALA